MNIEEAAIAKRFQLLETFLDERTRRLIAAAEAEALGYGGESAVARATGVSRRAIGVGRQELCQSPPSVAQGRVRRTGGGRKTATKKDPALCQALRALIEGTTRGDPMSPLLWTCKSVRRLAEELARSGHSVSYPSWGGRLRMGSMICGIIPAG